MRQDNRFNRTLSLNDEQFLFLEGLFEESRIKYHGTSFNYLFIKVYNKIKAIK